MNNFKVTMKSYKGETTFVTGMNATLEEAKKYYIGTNFTDSTEMFYWTATKVEHV